MLGLRSRLGSMVPVLIGLSVPVFSGCSDDSSSDLSLAEDGNTGLDEGGDGDSEAEGSGTGDGDGDPTGGDDGGSGEGDGDPDPGQLTAGEWRDLDNWPFWLGLGEQDSIWASEFDRWGFDTRTRIPIVAAANGEPVADVEVVLLDAEQQVLWTARTDNRGRAELWPSLDGGSPSWPLTVECGDRVVELEAAPDVFEPVMLELDELNPVADLDLLFVIDTTGSMSDELEYLKSELGDVITRVNAEIGGDFDIRVSVNFYRDEGDAYVVRSFPFTTDVGTVLGQIADQSADGGGDTPEAVEQGLADGIDGHDWSSSARARLLFLVLDAAPHQLPEVRESLAATAESAAAQGIRIIPVGASGVTKDAEFLLRNLDIVTGGTYTFLTNHSGIGGPHLEPSVGDYQVELFNDLLVRLVVEALE